MKIKAEYIWIDGKTPTAKLRSKTKIMDQGTEPPIWGFDGSSTEQATGDQSDCVLKPVSQFPDPIRGGDNILVMCEVLNVDMTPHASNTRAACVASAENFSEFEPMFGLEQEYTFYEQSYDSLKYGQPLGFPPSGYPAPTRRILLWCWGRRSLWSFNFRRSRNCLYGSWIKYFWYKC